MVSTSTHTHLPAFQNRHCQRHQHGHHHRYHQHCHYHHHHVCLPDQGQDFAGERGWVYGKCVMMGPLHGDEQDDQLTMHENIVMMMVFKEPTAIRIKWWRSGWGVTNYGDTAEDFPEKLLEVEVGNCLFRSPWLYLWTRTFKFNSLKNGFQSSYNVARQRQMTMPMKKVPIVSEEVCQEALLGLATILPGMLCAGCHH